MISTGFFPRSETVCPGLAPPLVPIGQIGRAIQWPVLRFQYRQSLQRPGDFRHLSFKVYGLERRKAQFSENGHVVLVPNEQTINTPVPNQISQRDVAEWSPWLSVHWFALEAKSVGQPSACTVHLQDEQQQRHRHR